MANPAPRARRAIGASSDDTNGREHPSFTCPAVTARRGAGAPTLGRRSGLGPRPGLQDMTARRGAGAPTLGRRSGLGSRLVSMTSREHASRPWRSDGPAWGRGPHAREEVGVGAPDRVGKTWTARRGAGGPHAREEVGVGAPDRVWETQAWSDTLPTCASSWSRCFPSSSPVRSISASSGGRSPRAWCRWKPSICALMESVPIARSTMPRLAAERGWS